MLLKLRYQQLIKPFLKQDKTSEQFAQFLQSMTPPLETDGKIQCSLGMSKESEGIEITPLMKSFCVSMERYLARPLDSFLIGPDELLKKITDKEKAFIIDVREPAELTDGFITGAHNIPVSQLAARIGELPAETDYPIYIVCRSGVRTAYAALYLRSIGYTQVKSLEFGMKEWKARNYPVNYKEPL